MRILITIAALVGLTAGGALLYGKYAGGEPSTRFRTAEVTRGDLLITVGATGTLQPEEVVDIGAQVVGRISELAMDPRAETDPRFKGKFIDYCSTVEEGMVLAQIDRSVYQAQYNQAKASLERAKADLLQMEAKADQTEAEWHRAKKLSDLKLTNHSPTGSASTRGAAVAIKGISEADFLLARANHEIAKASVEVGKASILQQESALQLAETNLGYTVIKSPVRGTIIERRVNVGQTVVSSMNTPSLFLIAEDLRRMQVWAAVNEADIGRLKVGMPVHFSVDAFPEDIFHGTVYQIRLNAQMTQNVVIYTVVISVDNTDLKLLPYLTANVEFEIEERKNVLTVPTAALRFQPKPEQIVESAAQENEPPSAERSRGKEARPAEKDGGTLWVQQGDLLAPVAVRVGATDGVSTEVSADGLQAGLEVVLGEQRKETSSPEVNNPFAPPRFRARPKT